MTKKSRLLVISFTVLALLLAGFSLYVKNMVLLTGLVAFALVYGFLITRKKFRFGAGMSIFLITIELLVLAMLFTGFF
ncbi:MAG: hypothetical protein ACOYWZ_07085 [Bacillota bacterium]